MWHPGAEQQFAQQFGLLHRCGTDQHRLALLVPLGQIGHHGVELGVLGLVDQVGLVEPLHGLVRWDRHHAELVGLVQLGGLGLGGARHPGELLVQPEIVLQGDRGEGLVLGLDLDAFFGLDGLVHALVVPAAVQHPAGEFVDDQHLAGDDDVVLVLLVELLGLERVVQETHQRGVHRLVEVLDSERGLDLADALLADPDGPLGQVHLVVDIRLQPGHQPGEFGIPLR